VDTVADPGTDWRHDFRRQGRHSLRRVLHCVGGDVPQRRADRPVSALRTADLRRRPVVVLLRPRPEVSSPATRKPASATRRRFEENTGGQGLMTVNPFDVLKLDPTSTDEEIVRQAARLKQRSTTDAELAAIHQAVQALTGKPEERRLHELLAHA